MSPEEPTSMSPEEPTTSPEAGPVDRAVDGSVDGDFPDPLAIARRDLGERFSDLDQVSSVTLREGPRGKKLARWMTIKNRHTGAIHHHSLTLETGKKRQGSWELDEKRSITLSDDEVDEIGRLVDFVRRSRGEPDPQTVVRAELATIAQALDNLPTGDRASLLGELLGLLAGDREGLKRLARIAKHHPTGLAGVAAALDYGRYARALDQLEALLAEGAEPPALRRLLGEHPELLGSGHGEQLETHIPGSDEHDDVLARRTADGRLELVLFASPLAQALDAGAEPDRGHRPGLALADALGRLALDLAALGAERAAAGEVGVHRRARIVLGRDGDPAHQAALRQFNDNLRGIEVLSYDALVRTGQRVLEALRATVQAHVGGPPG